jgi:hypothetical protein
LRPAMAAPSTVAEKGRGQRRGSSQDVASTPEAHVPGAPGGQAHLGRDCGEDPDRAFRLPPLN